jgi:hypothetical protein
VSVNSTAPHKARAGIVEKMRQTPGAKKLARIPPPAITPDLRKKIPKPPLTGVMRQSKSLAYPIVSFYLIILKILAASTR